MDAATDRIDIILEASQWKLVFLNMKGQLKCTHNHFDKGPRSVSRSAFERKAQIKSVVQAVKKAQAEIRNTKVELRNCNRLGRQARMAKRRLLQQIEPLDTSLHQLLSWQFNKSKFFSLRERLDLIEEELDQIEDVVNNEDDKNNTTQHQSINDQSTNDQSTNDQSTNDQSNNDQSNNDQSNNDQSTNDQSNKDQSNKDQSNNDQSTNDQNISMQHQNNDQNNIMQGSNKQFRPTVHGRLGGGSVGAPLRL
jgi:cobalamin biosynthesis protein CobT